MADSRPASRPAAGSHPAATQAASCRGTARHLRRHTQDWSEGGAPSRLSGANQTGSPLWLCVGSEAWANSGGKTEKRHLSMQAVRIQARGGGGAQLASWEFPPSPSRPRRQIERVNDRTRGSTGTRAPGGLHKLLLCARSRKQLSTDS
eukprot:scaffold27939_cov81-Phaeocystis_antarctica.AAC.2